jgi:hypothetical protein
MGGFMQKKYVVRLRSSERKQLLGVIRRGKASVRKVKHAQILLKVDAKGPGWTDLRAAEAFGCHARAVFHLRRRFMEEGLEAALERKRAIRAPRARILDGDGEAQLIALSCGEPPVGYSQWSLRLLASKLVEFRWVDAISYETVRRTLKKTNSNRIDARVG